MTSLPTHATGASANPRPKLLAALRKTTSDSSDNESASENGSSASEDEAPARITAAKPFTASTPQPDAEESKEVEDSDGEDAYELMKKRLAANKKPTTTQEPAQQAQLETPIAATIESSEDEEEMPVRAHIRKSTATRTKTASPRVSPSPTIPSRRSSPGLFVTPDPSPAKKLSRKTIGSDSESDDASRPTHNADLQERVRRIREERLAKQQDEEAQQTKPNKVQRRRADQASGSDTDGESGRKLTQQAKPTRRAGKKAMEAMARDQQRISRNMQLTHQAKTKKRFTTQDLFKKFNYQAPGVEVAALPTPELSSALQSSDVEANQVHDTPPTSPPRHEEVLEKDITSTEQETLAAVPDERDNMDTPRPARVDKGKGRAPEFQHLPVHPWMKEAEPVTVQNAAVVVEKPSDNAMVELSDSDDDLQVQPKSRFPVFDRLPTKKQYEGKELVHLRALAQLAKSPQKGKKGQKSVTRGEMEYALALKARQQTAKAKEERIADLIKRGHNPETEEENEKRQAEIDDMVAMFEKQRQEDLELAKMERKEAKKNGEIIDDLPSSDEDDEDYVGSGEEDGNTGDVDLEAEAEVELSGSEDEEMDDEEIDNSNGFIADAANEDDEPEETAAIENIDEDADMEDDDANVPVRRPTVIRSRNKRVIDDDDESDAEAPEPASPTQQATQDDTAAAFGFGNSGPNLGLTQTFIGTMADLEFGSQPGAVDKEQNSLDFLRSLPETQQPADYSQAFDFVIPNSQALMSPQKESQIGVDPQFSLGISQLVNDSPAFSRTQLEDFEPTQDAGFSFSRSPAGLAPPPSTVDTVMMAVAESPIKQKKGKLRRRQEEAAVELSDVEDDLLDAVAEEEEMSDDDIQLPPKPSKDAFQKMQQAAKKAKAIEEFNKKKSMAREAVMEQAEESEDEYAGLGGASDDEEGEEDEELKDMIDHSKVKVNERKIAAFYAEKAVKDDEKRMTEIYKKMQKRGGLRRGAGGYDGFDMSDSEDEAEMRQRKKRAAFQKQTNALLQDQKVKALADDEKKKAFFNTLADFADEDDYGYLAMPAEEAVEEDDDASQKQQPEDDDIAIPDSQVDSQNMPAPANPLKRKSPDSASSSQKENRPPPHMRRTKPTDTLFRPAVNQEETEAYIADLVSDPHAVIIPDSQVQDADEDEEPVSVTVPSRRPIIDRLSLSRQSSIASTDEHLAFHAPSNVPSHSTSRIPSLIRQATSNLSVSSERSTSMSGAKESGIRRGGTGRSNIHAQAREAERRALLEKKEGKRKEALANKVKVGRGIGRSVLGGLDGGFE